MELDYGRLQAAVIDACDVRGWSQAELIERSGISRSTVQRIWRGEPSKPGKRTQRLLEHALGWESGSVMTVLRGGELARASDSPEPRTDSPTVQPRTAESLIDPDSSDPVIRELSTGPVRTDAFREELIRLYLDDVAEGRRRAEERAAERVRRLAAAAAAEARGEPPAERELKRKMDQLEELRREAEAEDKEGPDNPRQSANTA